MFFWYSEYMKAPTRKQLVKKLDSIFSQYIRMKNSRMGDATCVTCGVSRPWKQMQNGHFFTRGRYPTRWEENNCHVQCAACNVFLHGNYIVYTRYMIKRYGSDYVDELERISLSKTKIPTPVLVEMIDRYKEEVVKLESSPQKVSDDTPWGIL